MKRDLRISLIIPIYKKKEFIELALKSINRQTYKNFEVIITEDDNTLKEFIDDLRKDLNYKLIHVQQEDLGYRRNTALNNGLKVSSGEIIAVIDQDCIVHSKFLEEYVKNYNKGDLLTGRRVNLGKRFTKKIIKNKKIKFSILELLLSDSPNKKIIEGLYIPWLSLNHNPRILGSNFAIRRQVLKSINGFNEDYIGYGLEDVDLEKRVVMNGGKRFSMKNKSIQYHLYHPEPQGSVEKFQLNREILEKVIRDKIIICKNGLKKN